MSVFGPTSPVATWDAWLETSLLSLEHRGLVRTLRPTIPGSSAIEVQMLPEDLDAWVQGKPPPPQSTSLPTLSARQDLKTIKLFSLNDYLGLSTHPSVRAAAVAAAHHCGSGPRSSPVVGGYTFYHRELETALAKLKSKEEALLFPTGFAANLAVVSALAADGDVDIFSDELNHASIVDGARLARRGGTRLHIYRHNDTSHLEELLINTARRGSRTLVITDSLFSMDGDFADLKALAALRQRHGFLLAVDEAHATLVCGEHGGGAAEAQGVEHDVDMSIGTLSKGIGSLGGFVATSAKWKNFLVNSARAQVFSTALPVPTVAAALAALRVAEKEPWRREHVWALTGHLGNALKVSAQSPIVPVVLGNENKTMQASRDLLKRGFHVPGIRPPTVPLGTSRLRISLSAGHTTGEVDALIKAVQEVLGVGGDRDSTLNLGNIGSVYSKL